MPDVVISEFMDGAAVEQLSVAFETVYEPALADDPVRLAALLPAARALIVRNRTQVRGALLASARCLACVGRLGVGLDNIDTEECERRGIAVYPATGANSASVAEYVLTAALVLLRGAWLRSGDVAAGKWPRATLIGREVGGKTIGLVGFGGIARETASRATALGMSVIAADPYLDPGHPAWRDTEQRSVDAVFREADVVTLHVPLTPETHYLVDADRLALMRREAVLINTSRGGIVDEDALARSLAAGQIAGAALDVFEHEPLVAEAGARFNGLNVLLTPHIAGVTEESNVRVSQLVADKVLRLLRT